jgi:hypothetical protein
MSLLSYWSIFCSDELFYASYYAVFDASVSTPIVHRRRGLPEIPTVSSPGRSRMQLISLAVDGDSTVDLRLFCALIRRTIIQSTNLMLFDNPVMQIYYCTKWITQLTRWCALLWITVKKQIAFAYAYFASGGHTYGQATILRCCQETDCLSSSPFSGYSFFFLKSKYIKQASRLIKNLPVPSGTLVRKRMRLKLAALIKV